MALSAQALVSTEEARTYLGVAASDLPSDELLEQIIEGLSARIAERTGACYISDDDKDKASARMFTFDPGAKHAEVDNFRDATKVEVSATPNDEGSWLELAAGDYVAEPLGDPTFNRLRFLNPAELPAQGQGWGALSLHVNNRDTIGGQTPWPNQVRADLNSYAVVRITAKWGYGPDLKTVPAHVKLAVNMWLQNIHKRDQAFFSEDFGKAMAGLKMPADVEELLEGQGTSAGLVAAV